MATLGILGTNKFVTDERPKNWREGILRKYPNGQAALTAFIALLESEQTSDPEYNWWEKSLPTRTVFINNGGGYAAGDTTFVVDDSAAGDPGKILRKGYLVLNIRTGEQMRVVADQTIGTSVVVQRAFGEVVAATINDDDELRVVGNANEERGPLPTAIHYDPTKQFNLCQIFRTPLSKSRTAMKTKLRTEAANRQAKIECLELQSIDMEWAFIWGQRFETIGENGLPLRSTRGIVRSISALAPGNDNSASSGSLNETELLTYLEPCYRFGSTEKLWLCGSTALNVLTQIGKSSSTLNVNQGETEVVAGIRLTRIRTAFGDGLLRQHPLFNLYADWRKVILIVDLANIRYRYVDDLQFLRNRQSPGDDGRVDEFLAECGLEVHHADTHAVIRNVATYG
jgi:hypothetical protein